MTKRPHPVATLYTVGAVMRSFNVTRGTVWTKTWQHKVRLSEPMYRQDAHGRLLRVYTEGDIAVFREIFAVRVK